MRDLQGRSALVTGASRGLGRRIARALAGEGMHVALAARSAEALEELARELEGADRRAVALPTDLSRRDEIESLARRAEDELGQVDLVVNNAGVLAPSSYHFRDPDEIEHGVHVNLLAPMLLTRLLLPGMVERGRGHVVNLASLAGKSAPGFEAVYGATKAGLIGFTQSLRREYRGDGVSASAVCPGYVSETGMYAHRAEQTGITAPKHVGRASPDAVARAVVRAVEKDLPELLVNSVPVRPLLMISELSPSLGEALTRGLDMFRPFEEAAQAAREEGAGDRRDE